MSHALSKHLLVDLYGCPADLLNDVAALEKVMIEAAQRAGATVINSMFHHFSPFGVSGVVVIQESHLTIHTWPEQGFAAVDLFTCGTQTKPAAGFDPLKTRTPSHTDRSPTIHAWGKVIHRLQRLAQSSRGGDNCRFTRS